MSQTTIPDFGTIRTETNGITLECRAIAPGLSLHDLTMLFEEAAKGGDPLAGNPTKWPTVRGVKAVADAVLQAVYGESRKVGDTR